MSKPIEDIKDQETLIHLLRNPTEWTEQTLADAREKAAKELQRLWRLERHVRSISRDLSGAVGQESQ